MNGDFSLRAAVVDDAAEHVAARDPLIAIFVIVDLFLPRRLFGDRLVPGGQESFLSVEDAVEHVDDFTVRHGHGVRKPVRPPSPETDLSTGPQHHSPFHPSRCAQTNENSSRIQRAITATLYCWQKGTSTSSAVGSKMLMIVCTESIAPLMTMGRTISERWSGTEMPIVRTLPCPL